MLAVQLLVRSLAGVIPTFVILGPLALVAALFPAVFGALALWLRRWRVLFSIVSLASLVYLLHVRFAGHLGPTGWARPQARWSMLAGIAALGVAWSWHRAGRAKRGEKIAIAGSGKVEPILLGLLSLAFGALALAGPPANRQGQVVWTFEPDQPGRIASSPLVAGDRLYVALAQGAGFNDFGAVYCLDAANGQVQWRFDDQQAMRPVFSSPCLAGGRLYIGEGFHQDTDCKLYCLNAATGEKLWDFSSRSHVESSPCVAEGRVFFGAGDDGVFGLDAESGKELWHFPGLHVDTSPVVAGSRLYAGSGYGEAFAAFCLDTITGKCVWRMACDLPVTGSPVAAGDQVFFGLGNGDLVTSAERPAGALVCLDAATHEVLWRFQTGDAVFARPAIDEDRVYCCSRDGFCYCLTRRDGRLLWKQPLGSPAPASPCRSGGVLYAAGSAGQLCCLDAGSGTIWWQFEVARHAEGNPQILASPAVKTAAGGTRSIYLATSLDRLITSAAVVYGLEEAP